MVPCPPPPASRSLCQSPIPNSSSSQSWAHDPDVAGLPALRLQGVSSGGLQSLGGS